MSIVSDHPAKIAFDRATFERLIEAAYVLQEHNRKVRQLEQNLESQSEQLRQQERAQQSSLEKRQPSARKRRDADYTVTLAEIVEAQHQIQMRHLDLEKTLALVAESVARITRASGAAIGILNGANVRYRAGDGSTALPAGTEIALTSAICQASIRTGQVIRTKDVNAEFLFDPEPVRKRGIRSLLAVPIHYDGEIVGGLELYFDEVEGYADQDTHTCQLMAGLVTEALGRDAGVSLKKSMAEERSTMLAAIERLQPNLAALAGDQETVSPPVDLQAVAPVREPVCWNCSGPLGDKDQFCGNCGAPQMREVEEHGLQSKLASAWNKQQNPPAEFERTSGSHAAGKKIESQKQIDGLPGQESIPEKSQAVTYSPPFTPGEAEELVKTLASISETNSETNAEAGSESNMNSDPASSDSAILPENSREAANPTEEESTIVAERAAGTADHPPDELIWSSASRAQDFLESLPTYRTPGPLVRFWQSRRGDIYLSVAIALVVLVIAWGVWSNHVSTVGANGIVHSSSRARHANPDANLTLFDRLLIDFGLAERPEALEDKGNPNVQVWVDLNTAQYYCPGADLYEKTARGKLSSQREAQLDQFEPAYRKACD